jgi:hypothetical protein
LTADFFVVVFLARVFFAPFFFTPLALAGAFFVFVRRLAAIEKTSGRALR